MDPQSEPKLFFDVGAVPCEAPIEYANQAVSYDNNKQLTINYLRLKIMFKSMPTKENPMKNQHRKQQKTPKIKHVPGRHPEDKIPSVLFFRP